MSNNNNNNRFNQSSIPQHYHQKGSYPYNKNQRNYPQPRMEANSFPPNFNYPDSNNRNNRQQQYSGSAGFPPNYYYNPSYNQFNHQPPFYPSQVFIPPGTMPNYSSNFNYYPPPLPFPNFQQNQIKAQPRSQPKNAYGSRPRNSQYQTLKNNQSNPYYQNRDHIAKPNLMSEQKIEEKRQIRQFTPRKNNRSDEENSQISSYSSESEGDQEQVYYKKKVIIKRKDAVLDNKEEIRKWIEARRRNYPRKNLQPEEQQAKANQQQMSLLQKKIRKKLILINSDPRNLMKKQKDLDILRRFILYPRRPRKMLQSHRTDNTPRDRPFIEEIEFNQKPEIQVEKQCQNNQQIAEIAQPNITVAKDQNKSGDENQKAVEIPIKEGHTKELVERQYRQEFQRTRREQLSVDVIINHLQMKQQQDTKVLQNLMDYKSNGFHYRYQYQTLQTNLLLDNIFRDTSYMLQAIRYIAKNNFFD